jgi:bifunctional DNA-binding transcriptional regulator/antitoxin component of YhaV-PrlF toxin-antitoxin module
MERTKVVLAQPKSRSLRTTIPAGIARQFGIDEGSELGWDIQARDNELVIVVVPMPVRGTKEIITVESERPTDKPRRKG